MEGRREDLFHVPDLHQPAAKQHADPVGQRAHHRKVVGDEQHREVVLAPKRRSSARTLACTETSRADSTSSQSSSVGSATSARAIATRWRSPPDSWSG